MRKKIALLSNVTVSMIVQKLKKEYEIYVPSGFDTFGQEILNPSSMVYKGGFDAVIVLIDGMESRHWNTEKEAYEKLDLWGQLMDALADKAEDIPVFISSISVFREGIKSVKEIDFHFEWENRWVQKISRLAEEKRNIYIFDVKSLIEDIGKRNFYSEKMWYMGSMPYSKTGIEAISGEIKLLMKSAFEPVKKILAVDLDNTLWGGVIGEDGAEGILLEPHREGEIYYNLQRCLLEMKKRGTLLAVVSKNNYNDVEPVWEHPHMLLKKSDFVSIKINWKPKSENIKEMEKELNLTESSFAFLDDNPMEQEEVRLACPEVLVIDFPEDASMLAECMEEVYREYFRPLSLTQEDKIKTQLYQMEKERKKEENSCVDLDTYLINLKMRVDIHLMEKNELERTVQLCNKTNQFNLTTRRYTGEEILNYEGDIFVAYLEDKFGQQGLVGVLMLKKEPPNARIDNFFMSCRVMGRRLEEAMIGKIEEFYSVSAEKIIGEFLPTQRNQPVEFLYDNLGFYLTDSNDEGKTYEMRLKKGGEIACPVPGCFEEVSFRAADSGE